MPKQEAAFVGSRRTERRWLLPSVLLLVAGFFSFLGVNCLWHHFRDAEYRPFRAPAGMVLVVAGAVQFRIAAEAWRKRRDAGRWKFQSLYRPLLWQWLLVGMVASYTVGLMLGPDPYVRYFFRASLGFWTTVGLLPLVVGPTPGWRLSLLASSKTLRGLRWGALAAALAFVSAEAVLRTYSVVSGDSLSVTHATRELKLTPGETVRGQKVNRLGYWDDDFQTTVRAGRLRIVALGDDALLSGTSETNSLALVEQMLPGVDVFNFALPRAGPREYAAQFAHEASRFQPDLVLAMLSVGDDVTHQIPLPGAFDWRSLHCYQLGVRSWGSPISGYERPATGCTAADDLETYLQEAAARMAICRTPIDEATHRRWKETLGCLDAIAGGCRRRHIAFALVLLPDGYQLDDVLCRTLCRRTGCRKEQLDLQLPQRRLTVYAQQRGLPVLDLLPSFQAAGCAPYGRYSHLWNDHGNALAAEVISAWLSTRYGTMLASASTLP